jgi:hypothetical protein
MKVEYFLRCFTFQVLLRGMKFSDQMLIGVLSMRELLFRA